MDDVRAVMDAVGVQRAAIMGISEAGSLASLFAASHPERCQAVALFRLRASSSWFPTEAALQQFYHYADTSWGTGASLPMFVPSMVGNKAFQERAGRFQRLGATPAACIEIMRLNSQIDVSAILPTIHIPTLVIHRQGDVAVDVEGGREIAALVPGARYIELPGTDHIPFIGDNAGEIVDAVQGVCNRLAGTSYDQQDPCHGSLYRHRRLDREGGRPWRPALARLAGHT